VQGVVAILGIERNLDVVFAAPIAIENLLHLATEVALDLQNQAADPLILIRRPIRKDLVGERVHAATRFSGSNCTENGYPGEQSALGNGEPSRGLGGAGLSFVMDFSDDQEKIGALRGLGVRWQPSRADAMANLEREDVEAREHAGIE
jgi:hypothetical protein